MDGMFRMFSNIFPTKMMRRCPKVGRTPSHHPFLFGIFHEKNIQLLGYSIHEVKLWHMRLQVYLSQIYFDLQKINRLGSSRSHFTLFRSFFHLRLFLPSPGLDSTPFKTQQPHHPGPMYNSTPPPHC